MMNNTHKRIVRSQNHFDNIKAVCARSFPQCVEIGTNSALLCATLSGVDSGIASAQIIFGSRLYFCKYKTGVFQRHNVHFVTAATPVPQENFHSCATQKLYGVIFPQRSAQLTRGPFFFFKKK